MLNREPRSGGTQRNAGDVVFGRCGTRYHSTSPVRTQLSCHTRRPRFRVLALAS